MKTEAGDNGGLLVFGSNCSIAKYTAGEGRKKTNVHGIDAV